MLNIALCDDDPAARAHARSLLEDYLAKRHLAAQIEEYQTAAALLDGLKNRSCQILLLDILMPGFTGMQAARELRGFDGETQIVFLTSSPEFAVESYQVDAFSYLLKPIHKEALFPVLDKLQRQLQRSGETLLLPTASGLLRLGCHQVEALEVNSKKLLFYLDDGSVQRISGSLSEFEPQLLKHRQFIKIHRSYLVNMDAIRRFGGAEITTYSGRSFPISRLLSQTVRKAYLDYLFEKEG